MVGSQRSRHMSELPLGKFVRLAWYRRAEQVQADGADAKSWADGKPQGCLRRDRNQRNLHTH
jgi:hypothetical protein